MTLASPSRPCSLFGYLTGQGVTGFLEGIAILVADETGVMVDQSMYTGETVPVRKQPAAASPELAALAW